MSRGKVLEYLGMKIDFDRKGKVTLSMEDYIKKLLNKEPYNMEGNAKTPAAKKLPEEWAQIFHHIAANLLYLCRRTM